MTLLAYANSTEEINSASTDYPSSSDDDDESVIMSPYTNELTDSPSKIIAEAQRILFTHENKTDMDKNQNFVTTTIEMNGILVKKVNDDENLEKTKKCVRFNMENNKLHEYNVDLSESLSSMSLDDSAFIANVLDATDLLASDSELSEDDYTHSSPPREQIRLAFTDSDQQNIPSNTIDFESNFPKSSISQTSVDNDDDDDDDDDNNDLTIDEMMREKIILQQEIADLRAEYQAEVKRLSEEYEARRESYLTNLDDLRGNMYDRLDLKNENKEEKMKSLEEEKKSIKIMEEDLDKRRKQCFEQKTEIEEYESYLDRRHDAMNDKEEDLKILQDELEEFSRLLRKRERDLKSKSERIDKEENAEQQIGHCSHDEKEIDEMKEKIKSLQNDVLKARIEIEKKEENIRDFENKLQSVETENKRLQTKVKNLESQLLLDKKINEAREECSYVRRTSVMTLANTPGHRLNGTIQSSSLSLRPISGGNKKSQIRGHLNGSTLSNESAFFNNTVKRKITEETVEEHSTTQRVDSRSIKSRTCIIM